MWKTCARFPLYPYFSKVCMPGPKQETVTTTESELSASRWSVISFERCEASGLTYEQAAERLRDLEKQKVTGLCIVTDEAAARIKS
jgi:hypothetical protein